MREVGTLVLNGRIWLINEMAFSPLHEVGHGLPAGELALTHSIPPKWNLEIDPRSVRLGSAPSVMEYKGKVGTHQALPTEDSVTSPQSVNTFS